MEQNFDTFTTAPYDLPAVRHNVALCQAELVRSKLGPIASEIVPITTIGDKVLDRSLADAGGKGLFIRNWKNPSSPVKAKPPSIR